MLIANSEKICVTRGDDARITVAVDGYSMQEGDIMYLTVRPCSGHEGPPLLSRASVGNVIDIAHEDTARLDVGEYSADIQMNTADGKVYTVWPMLPDRLRGTNGNFRNFVVMPEVTR